MKPDDEQLFFGHDLATPLTNLHGAHFLLKASLKGENPAAQEALDILQGNIHSMERMLGWYWRIREVEGQLQPVDPWPLSGLFARLAGRIEGEELPVHPPAAVACQGRTQVPQEPLEIGLLGAAITLNSASEREVRWTFEAGEGVLWSHVEVDGDQDLLDPGRLFRKVYWPSRRKISAWSDPSFPYLRAVLEPFGGSLELVWAGDLWRLTASVPVVP